MESNATEEILAERHALILASQADSWDAMLTQQAILALGTRAIAQQQLLQDTAETEHLTLERNATAQSTTQTSGLRH